MGRHKKLKSKAPPKPRGKRIGRFELMGATIELIDHDGRLDLLGLNADGKPRYKLTEQPDGRILAARALSSTSVSCPAQAGEGQLKGRGKR
jgi:hypothetical protein